MSEFRTVKGVRVEFWDKSFRISHDGLYSPVFCIETSVENVVDFIKTVRRYQRGRDADFVRLRCDL